MNQLVIVVIVGFILVGGIASFSIYLQQDDALAAVERVINPNFACAEKYDWFQKNELKNPDRTINQNVQDVIDEFTDAGCYRSFREWMPQSHPDWDLFVVGESVLKTSCEKYLRGELVLKEEWEKTIWKEKGCKDFLKQFD